MTTTEPRTEPLATPGSGADKAALRQSVKRRPLYALLSRFWLVLVLAAVIAVSGFVVHRLHEVFGVHSGSFGGGSSADVIDQFNAKTITLEVWGSPGSTATINYLDENSHPQQALNVPLPWNDSIEVNEARHPGQPGSARKWQLDRLPVRREQPRRAR